MLSLASNYNHKRKWGRKRGNQPLKSNHPHAHHHISLKSTQEGEKPKRKRFLGVKYQVRRQHPQCHPIITVWVSLCFAGWHGWPIWAARSVIVSFFPFSLRFFFYLYMYVPASVFVFMWDIAKTRKIHVRTSIRAKLLRYVQHHKRTKQ